MAGIWEPQMDWGDITAWAPRPGDQMQRKPKEKAFLVGPIAWFP